MGERESEMFNFYSFGDSSLTNTLPEGSFKWLIPLDRAANQKKKFQIVHGFLSSENTK